MRWRRWFLYLGLAAVGLVVVLAVASWLVARSAWAANQVAALIAEATGAPVQVGTLNVGVTGRSLRNLQFLEDGASENTTPWAVVPEVVADLSLAQLVRGDLAGGTVTLRNPTVNLRLDGDDNVVTKLPSLEGGGRVWPVFRIVNGQVTLHREGRPDTVIQAISGELRKDGGRITLAGRTDDPEWGPWTLGGGRDGANAAYALTLHADRFHATIDKLRRVPFVPPVVWEQIQIEGDSPVDLALEFGGPSAGSDVRYRVDLAPRNVTAHVGAIDLTVEQTRGHVRVEDGMVKLTGIRGRAAGGEIGTDATLDFRGEGSDFRFDASADGLALQQLPASWGLPKLDGRMSGKADMQIEVRGGEVRTHGQGQGTIAGFLGKALQVRMVAGERGYRFDISDTRGVSLSPAIWPRLIALALVSVQPPTQPTSAATQPVKDLEVNFGLRDVDVAELLRGLEVPVPFKLEGKLTFQVKAAVPLRDVKDLKAYRLNGTASMASARLEGLELQNLRARIVYEEGVARLEELSAGIPADTPNAPPGTISGTAQIGVIPAGDLSAKLTLATLPVKPLLAAIPNTQAGGGGTADGEVQLRAPAGALRDITLWDATARLTAKGVSAFGRSAEELAFQAQLRDGVVSVTEARTRLNGAAISGTGQVRLAGQYPYTAHVELPPSDLAALQQVVPELRSVRLAGKGQTTADARGTLNPLTVQASGDAQVEGLAVNDFRVGTLRSRWDADTDRLRLTGIAANLYGGDLTGSATVPLKPTVAGQVELRLHKLDTTNLTKDVSSPVRLEGAAQGSVTVDLPAAREGHGREITADVKLQAERLRIQNIPADKMQASVVYRNGAADYRIEGETLGGKFDLNGRYPPQLPAPANDQGRLNVRDIDLSRLAGVFGSDTLRSLGGRVSLAAGFRFDEPAGEPSGTGDLTIDHLTWGGRMLFDRLGGIVQLGGGVLSIPELAGQLGGGSLRARLTYDYRRPDRSVAIVTAQRVEAATLFAPFSSTPPVTGPLDARLVTRLGREWSGTGQVVLPYGKLFGVSVRDARFPLGWSVAPGRRGELRLQDASAQASRGRLTARAELAWGETARLDGQASFSAVDVGELLSHYAETQVVGGLANGRVTFSGRDMRSAADVTARVDATLTQATPSQLPVFRQIMPFVLPGIGTNVQFQRGDLRGALAGGVIRIERLTLAGDLARLYAEGTVTLQQRLNLDVVANTNQLGIDPSVLQLFNLALPAVGPVPLGLLNQATSYLSNRTISVRVTGTVRAPSVQVNPVPFLTESVVRYFLSQTGVPIPTAVQSIGFPGR